MNGNAFGVVPVWESLLPLIIADDPNMALCDLTMWCAARISKKKMLGLGGYSQKKNSTTTCSGRSLPDKRSSGGTSPPARTKISPVPSQEPRTVIKNLN